MKLPSPYRLADNAISQLNKSALRLADQTKQRLTVLGFDELNVLQNVDAMYAKLDSNNRKKFLELFIARYIEVMAYVLGRELTADEEDAVDDLAELYISGLLDEPNETTKYTYSAEVLRKRDRAKEAIISVPTKAQKQIQLDKHIRYEQQMVSWYADFTSQGAEIEAYKAAGVKRVQRHEHDDEKTCNVCRAADGKIYPINKIPPLDHIRCRRWFTPA